LRLKSLSLENIRSYKGETPTINVPLGTILFEGDIACGKSTILYAIEFALFGLGSIGGGFLLRNGTKKGSVTLQFEVNDAEYEVHRGLVRKGKLVHQDDCYLIGPDGKSVLSPTEMKEKILQVLGFNEPQNPRAQSVIYRYAIFTPQEEMKEVILRDPDNRLQTLRKAFRIEDYKIASDNSTTLTSKMQEKISHLQGATQDIDDIKKRIEEESATIEGISKEMDSLKLQEQDLGKQLKGKTDELKQLETEREKIRQTESTIPLLQKQLDENGKQLDENSDQTGNLTKRINEEIQPKVLEFESVKKPTDKSLQELKKLQDDIRVKLQESQKLRGRFDERIGNFTSIMETKTCPVCERPVNPDEFRDRSRHLEEDRKRVEQEITEDGNAISQLDSLTQELTAYLDAQNQLTTLRTQLNEINTQIQLNNDRKSKLTSLADELTKKLDAAKREIEPLQNVLYRIELLDKEKAQLDTNLTDIGKRISAKEATMEASVMSRKDLRDQLTQKQKDLQTLGQLREHKLWLGEYLTPTIENIEKHVMTSLNQRFNDQFQRWFQILIDDPDMQVRVNEDFSPLVEHEGYEQEFIGLSGGEKTSVALAYRLALNTLVQEVAIEGGSNLLILDEPTDGFSREQVLKIRDILTELRCPQVILVSHERELEGFADHVIEVRKSNGISQLTPRVESQSEF
jgi:exonuclease SbcC